MQILATHYNLAATLNQSFKRVPIMGKMAQLYDGVFLPKGTEGKGNEAVQILMKRQEDIENTGNFNSLSMFVEGCTTNGTALMKFKKGAFVGNRRVKPMLLKYELGTVHQAYVTIELLPLAVMCLSWGCMNVEIIDMPEFEPN